MGIYYRLQTAQNGHRLPGSWSYLDPFTEEWTGETVEWVDNRQPGCQVWTSAARVAVAAAGVQGVYMDGNYPASEYPTLLRIEADDDYVSDGVDEWLAVEPEGVKNVFGLRSSDLVQFVTESFEADSECGDLQEWLEDHEEEIAEWIEVNGTPVPVEFTQTLPGLDEYLAPKEAQA